MPPRKQPKKTKQRDKEYIPPKNLQIEGTLTTDEQKEKFRRQAESYKQETANNKAKLTDKAINTKQKATDEDIQGVIPTGSKLTDQQRKHNQEIADKKKREDAGHASAK